jgi:LemA protein
MIDTLWIVLGVAAVILVYVWVTYNSLVTARIRVTQSWKDIDIQLKKRYDLLPDLVESAKKATALDKEILTEVTRLRSEGMKAAQKGVDPAERGVIEEQLSSLMRDVKVQIEAYPDIKSHQELLKLMGDVGDIEDKIAYARQFYNSNAAEYNTKIKLFPAVLVASVLGFSPAHYFEAEEKEREDVKVKL